jgi:two-component system, chemotaxis family, CheB/CheR fusion protein
LQSLALQVMSSLHQVDRNLTDCQGRHYQLRIVPYRTVENKIDGAVISIYDSSPQAHSEAAN